MTTDHVRDLVQVILVDDPDDSRVYSSIEGLGAKRSAVVVAAAFACAILDQWPHGATLESIRDYVRNVRAKVESDNKPSQHVAEAVIRAGLNEDTLARELPADEIFRAQMWLIYEIAHGLYLDEAARSRFVDEAVTVSNQWLQEG